MKFIPHHNPYPLQLYSWAFTSDQTIATFHNTTRSDLQSTTTRSTSEHYIRRLFKNPITILTNNNSSQHLQSATQQTLAKIKISSTAKNVSRKQHNFRICITHNYIQKNHQSKSDFNKTIPRDNLLQNHTPTPHNLTKIRPDYKQHIQLPRIWPECNFITAISSQKLTKNLPLQITPKPIHNSSKKIPLTYSLNLCWIKTFH